MAKSPQAFAYPVAFRFYYVVVVLAALLGLGVARHPAPAVPASMWVVALLLMLLSETSTVTMPGGGYVSMGGVLDIACLVLLGPVFTAWLNLASSVPVQALVLRKPPLKVVHNAAVFVLTALGAGYAFLAAGGRLGSLSFPRDIVPLLACGTAYFVLNSFLISTVIGLSEGPNPFRVWQRSFLSGLLHHVSFLAFGSLVALVYLAAGPWALLLFVIPFLLARHSFKLYVELRTDLKDFVRALSEILEEVDPYTRQHSVRVARYATQLARALRRPEREIDDLECAALVHDLGKIGPQNQHILQKPGSLSHEEQRTLRSHPAAGAAIVSRVRALRRTAEIVRHHHERPDGHGYPHGLRSDSVPVGARILNVADAFDAMTSDRPYRRALGVEAALRELDRGAGTQFDDEVVEVLVRLHREGRFCLIPSPSSEELRSLKIHPRGARA